MPLDEPSWWYDSSGSNRWLSAALKPAGWIYGRIAERRWQRARAFQAKLPVICIGNFTAGGTGKTPLTIEVVRLLREAGQLPAILTRGYGGSERGPRQVDPAADHASQVGDEALLLAQAAETWISRDRAAGARAIEVAAKASVIVMDDGLQNPALAKSLTIAVVDGARGIGNGNVIPAGPLRASLSFQLRLADAIVINGGVGETAGFLEPFRGPYLRAMPVAAGQTQWIHGAPIVAFAGIGNPGRFFDLLKSLGGDIRHTKVFADHKPLTEADAAHLLDLASRSGATLVTTEKDRVRMSVAVAGSALTQLRTSVRTLPIRLAFAEGDECRLAGLLASALDAHGQPA